MNATDRYRAVIEARIAAPIDGREDSPGQHYLRSARVHAPGGALVYSRAAIVDFLGEFHDKPAKRPAAPEAPEAPEIISAPVPGATLLAARYRSATTRTTCLSLAVMRGDWITEEWLFGPEPPPSVPEQVDPKRLDLFSVLPDPAVEQAPASMPGAAKARGPVAGALQAFQRACNRAQADAFDSLYARDVTLDLADGGTERDHHSAADFYRGLCSGFLNPVLHAEQIVAPAEDARAAVLWRLTGSAPNMPRSVHLCGLSFWCFDPDGRIIADATRFDATAMQSERAADKAAWRA